MKLEWEHGDRIVDLGTRSLDSPTVRMENLKRGTYRVSLEREGARTRRSLDSATVDLQSDEEVIVSLVPDFTKLGSGSDETPITVRGTLRVSEDLMRDGFSPKGARLRSLEKAARFSQRNLRLSSDAPDEIVQLRELSYPGGGDLSLFRVESVVEGFQEFHFEGPWVAGQQAVLEIPSATLAIALRQELSGLVEDALMISEWSRIHLAIRNEVTQEPISPDLVCYSSSEDRDLSWTALEWVSGTSELFLRFAGKDLRLRIAKQGYADAIVEIGATSSDESLSIGMTPTALLSVVLEEKNARVPIDALHGVELVSIRGLQEPVSRSLERSELQVEVVAGTYELWIDDPICGLIAEPVSARVGPTDFVRVKLDVARKED